MPSDIFQCAVNFSEGRRASVVDALAEAMSRSAGARLIDYSFDYDHNRCVMTLLGNAEGIFDAVLGAARVAVEKIDMRAHQGVHPRTGAIDVVPIVPLWETDPEHALTLADSIGHALAEELSLPVYFYERSARAHQKSALPDIRRGGFEAVRDAPLNGERLPDLGSSHVHPTAGLTIVGARGPLVAYNIDLAGADTSVARQIATRIRRERTRLPELTGVRALGLFLASRNRAQVSMNLTAPDQTPLPAVYRFVAEEAAKLGIGVEASELIGALPIASLGGEPPDAIRWKGYKPAQILETWFPTE